MQYELVEVSGETCASCISMLPIVRRLAEKYHLPLRHLEVTPATAAQAEALAVDRLPTLIVMCDGAEIARVSGYQPEEILDLWLEAKTQG